MASEFSLIERYFRGIGPSHPGTRLGPGDDAAVVTIPDKQQLVTSMDTLIAGVHFPEQTSAADIAHKALTVNLSDLAAMAATPTWFLLSISLPDNNETWLKEFSQSLSNIAETYDIELIGGDTCHGHLSITIQVNGIVEQDCYVTRRGATPGDLIVVSGNLGNAALGLAHIQNRIILPEPLASTCIDALNRPTPRLCLTEFLQKFASAAIDISDGLVGDLKHILDESDVGASIRQSDLPVNQWIKDNDVYRYALAGGDDYELCFTLPKQNLIKLTQWNLDNQACSLQVIGEIVDSGYCLDDDQQIYDLSTAQGYQHFGK